MWEFYLLTLAIFGCLNGILVLGFNLQFGHAGIINLAVGAGLVIFLHAMLGARQGSPYLIGLVPGFIGVGMLIYAFFLAEPVL